MLTYKFFYEKFFIFFSNLVIFISNIILLILEKNDTYKTILIFSNFIIGISFLIAILSFFITFKNYKTQVLVKKTLDKQDNYFYIILSKNLKIINISKSLLKEFGLKSLKRYRFRNIIYLFNDKIRIYKNNQKNSTNKEFIIYLKDLLKEKKDFYFSFNFYNFNGNEVELKLFLNNQDSYFKTLYGNIETNVSNFSSEFKQKELENDFNQIYDKFINVSNLINEGIYIYDLEDQTIWLSSKLKEILDIDQTIEILEYEEFKKLIHKDDLKNFNLKLNQHNDLSNLELSYRLLINNKYYWFIEKSRKTKIDNKTTVISVITLINTKSFVKHNIEILDNLKEEYELPNHIDKLIKDEVPFLLASIKITNLREINEKYSREVANMALSEYIRKIKERFITKSGDIFRLTGSRFQFTITDIRNLGLLKDGFLQNQDYLNMSFNYGGYSFSLNIKAGVSIFRKGCYNTNEVIKGSLSALDVAMDLNYSKNIYIHGDLKDEKRIM